MEVQLAELRSDVRHIQTDVSDIKVAGRETNNGLMALREKLEHNGAELNKRVDAVGTSINKKVDEIPPVIDAVRRELSEGQNSMRTEVLAKVDSMATRMDNERKELSALNVAVRDELTTRFERSTASAESGREELYKKLSGDISSRGTRSDERLDELGRKVDTNHKEVTDKIERVKNDVWKTRLWMLAAQIAVEVSLAGTLLTVMAKGFHWI